MRRPGKVERDAGGGVAAGLAMGLVEAMLASPGLLSQRREGYRERHRTQLTRQA
jgi:hypothetical protein